MKLGFSLSYMNLLLLLAGLIAYTSVMAKDADPAIDTQQIVENSAVPSTDPAVDNQNAKASFKNPNSPLVEMAFKFKNTEGSPHNYAEVAAGYCKAARSGDADAQYALAWMYLNGRGVSVNKSIAAQLYTMAAEQGHVRAEEALTEITDTLPRSDLPTCFFLPDPPAASAPDLGTATTERKDISPETAALFYSQAHILKLVTKLAPRYNIDTNLAMAFIAVESGFNTQATSAKNAQGLMQLIPETAQRFGVKNAYKAEDNIKGGLAYLQWLLAYFKGDVQLVAAAYNAGEATVEKYKGVPPYAETQMYVKKIAKLYNNRTHPYLNNLVKTSPLLNLPNKRTM
jgi:TPR repeat protein